MFKCLHGLYSQEHCYTMSLEKLPKKIAVLEMAEKQSDGPNSTKYTF